MVRGWDDPSADGLTLVSEPIKFVRPSQITSARSGHTENLEKGVFLPTWTVVDVRERFRPHTIKDQNVDSIKTRPKVGWL
jgi:hypothetical protein